MCLLTFRPKSPILVDAVHQVSTYTTFPQYRSAIGMDGDGDFVVVWASWTHDGSDTGVFGQRFCQTPSEVTQLDVDLADPVTLHFTWNDVALADDYVLLEDVLPNGSFGTISGTASSGSPGLMVPMPSDSTYFLVLGRRSSCGSGPE